MEPVELIYRLPVTTVRISGTRQTVTNPVLDPSPITTATSSIAIGVEADRTRTWTLHLPAPEGSETEASLSVSPDGRLKSAETTVDSKSGELLRAFLTSASKTALTLAPLAAGLFAPAAIPATLFGATVAAAARADGYLLQRFDSASAVQTRPSFDDLHVAADYVTEAEPEAAILANLRWSNALLIAAIAGASVTGLEDPLGLSDRLSALSRAQTIVRGQLAEAEAAYLIWVNKHNRDSVVETFDERFSLDMLPGTDRLLRVMAKTAERQPSEQRWWDLLTYLKIAVSWSYEDEDPEEDGSGQVLGTEGWTPNVVVYRRPRLATVIHWRAVPAEGDPEQLTLVEVLRESKVVVMPHTEAFIPLLRTRRTALGRPKPTGDSSTSISFDADGLLATVSTKRASKAADRIETLQAIPGIASDLVAARTAFKAPQSPETKLARLKADLDLAETQGKLDELSRPTKDDPLQSLKATVARAELEARKARAELVMSDPTKSLVEFSTTS